MQDLRTAVAERLDNPPAYPKDRFDGRGIVTCAGGQRYFTCAWVLLWLLRRVHRSTLPVQIWHLGRAEMSDEMRSILEKEDVEVINAETVLHQYPAKVGGGWPLKPYAIAQSRFREVLFLDSDTVPLIAPDAILDWEMYGRSGLLFWPDIIDLRDTNPIWRKLGLEPRNCISVDSSVIAIDKERAWDVLDLTILLNEYWEETYRFIHGDKDTFLLAAILTGRGYNLIPHRPFSTELDLIQRGPEGDALLHHRTSSKWNLFGSNAPVVDDTLNAQCEEALAELRKCWSGSIFQSPEKSARARATEAALIASRRFHYQSNGSDRYLELLAAGVVGEGRGEHEQYWAVIERDDRLVLQFFSDTRLAVELLLQADGSWRGQSLGNRVFDTRLVAKGDRDTWPNANEKHIGHSAEDLVAALLKPDLFASGFDSQVAQEIRAAFTLLNRLFDDVPEQISAHIADLRLPAAWRKILDDLALELRANRDARKSLAAHDVVHPLDINPAHYTRIV